MTAKFPLGSVVATPGALAALDRAENERSVAAGFRLLSAYTLSDGTRIWIITEADRSSTCLLLPEEY
jgi:hypothetical protein